MENTSITKKTLRRGARLVTTIQLETITPSVAKLYLASANALNRALSAATVEAYTRAIMADAWEVTHQGIAFDLNEMLIDGHHRLTAIVRAGKSVQMYVTRGLPPHVVAVVDGGRSRTVQHQFRLTGDVRSSAYLAGVRTCLRLLRSGGTAEGLSDATDFRYTRTDIVKFETDYPAETEWLRVRAYGKRQHPSAVKGAMMFYYRAFPDVANDFYEKLFSGAMLAPRSAVLAYSNWLYSRNKLGRQENPMKIARLAIRAMEAHRHNQPLEKLYDDSETIGGLVTNIGEKW